MKPCQYCKKPTNNKTFCSPKCHYTSMKPRSVRGVLKQAKTVAEYYNMCKVASKRAMSDEKNPF